jgi:N-acetyl-1-D-myo-inositol-2-amino-2-deoxy-alpha-D-glucopyranoside deacetylase
LLFVHAHPDDESIETGATMAKYAAEGAYVCLVTCTLGEQGEIVPDELRHLAADREDRLGPRRAAELTAAGAALGLHDQRFLGGAGRWRDSGMMGFDTNDDPRCFWQADLQRAAADLVPIIREVRPQVMVTYDSRGYYGHPDHIQAHRVALLAAERAADARDEAALEPWQVAKIYATAMPLSALTAGLAALRASDSAFEAVGSVSELPFGIPDDQVTTSIDASEYAAAKVAALQAHYTQIMVEPPFYALTNNIGQLIDPVEHYTLISGERGPAEDPNSRERDLFVGL